MQVFGLIPGEVATDDEGRPVHAEVFAGDFLVWLPPETADHQLASPATLGAATAHLIPTTVRAGPVLCSAVMAASTVPPTIASSPGAYTSGRQGLNLRPLDPQ